MSSRHGHRFDHDDEAPSYDADVQRTDDPIRAGYATALAWVAARAAGAGRVLELGAGTGNLTALLPPTAIVTAVDLSAAMMARARDKAVHPNVTFVREDLLTSAEDRDGPWDAVVSTYAVHHLEPDEKRAWIDALVPKISPGGVLAVADLMFADASAQAVLVDRIDGLKAVVDDEFFWDLDAAVGWLTAHGTTVTVQRFSDLSWGLCARCP